MDFTSTALLIVTVLVATGAKDMMNPALVALALTHVLQLSGTVSVRLPSAKPPEYTTSLRWGKGGLLSPHAALLATLESVPYAFVQPTLHS